jgi:hypothetical protein
VSDEFGDDRIVGNLVRIDRMNSGGGETGVEALAYSPPDRELDEILCVEFGELHARACRQRVTQTKTMGSRVSSRNATSGDGEDWIETSARSIRPSASGSLRGRDRGRPRRRR